MKKILLTLILGGALASCNRNENDIQTTTTNIEEGTPILEKVFLKKIKNDDGDEEITFFYDEENHKIKEINHYLYAEENAKRTFSYNHREQIVYSEYQKGDESIKDNYFYNNNGTLRKSVSVLHNNSSIETITRNYDYSTEGKIIVNHKKEDKTYNTLEERIYTYILDGKKVVKRIINYPEIMTVESNYTYDTTHKTPFSNVKGLDALMLVEGFYSQDEGFGLIYNIKEIQEKQIQAFGNTESTFKNEWIYNNHRYPIRKIISVQTKYNTKRAYTYEY